VVSWGEEKNTKNIKFLFLKLVKAEIIEIVCAAPI